MREEDEIAGRISTVSAGGHPPRACSGRRSEEDDSGFGAGADGSPDRHSQGVSGATSPPPLAGRAAGSGRGSDLAGSQQHAVGGRAEQQERAVFDATFAAQDEAETSPDTHSIRAASRGTTGRSAIRSGGRSKSKRSTRIGKAGAVSVSA